MVLPDHEHVVPARGGDLQRPACALLTAHLGEVRKGFTRCAVVRRGGGAGEGLRPAQMGANVQEMTG